MKIKKGDHVIVLAGKDTAGRFCLIDMHVPPGGGPPPHRHDFEETFTILEGELEATFRGAKRSVKAGETIHIPANAPHQFHNSSSEPVRMLCICSPAGQEEFFLELGLPVATRTTAPPKLDEAAETAFRAKAAALAPRAEKSEPKSHAATIDRQAVRHAKSPIRSPRACRRAVLLLTGSIEKNRASTGSARTG